MIGILNENSLHNTLKHIYCPPNGSIEKKVGDFFCDIVCGDGSIIEIQTGNFNNIKKKLEILTKTHVIELIYPISSTTYIKTLNEDASLKSCNKSPLHGSIFQICREISPIAHLVKNKNLKITILFIESITTKIDDKKGRSRYKNARIIDRELVKILKEETYDSIASLLFSMLALLPPIFSTKDIEKLGYKKYTSYITWFFKKLSLIEETEKIGKLKLYKKTLDSFIKN